MAPSFPWRLPKSLRRCWWLSAFFQVAEVSNLLLALGFPLEVADVALIRSQPSINVNDVSKPLIETAVVAFLEQLRKDNADDIAKDFSTYAAYAKRFVNELSEFGSINHCWSVELEESYHNEAIVEYSDWLALIRLSGVPRGLLK